MSIYWPVDLLSINCCLCIVIRTSPSQIIWNIFYCSQTLIFAFILFRFINWDIKMSSNFPTWEFQNLCSYCYTLLLSIVTWKFYTETWNIPRGTCAVSISSVPQMSFFGRESGVQKVNPRSISDRLGVGGRSWMEWLQRGRRNLADDGYVPCFDCDDVFMGVCICQGL